MCYLSNAWLQERGLKVSGNKAELVQRLLDSPPLLPPKGQGSAQATTTPSSFREAQNSPPGGGGGSTRRITVEESSMASRLAPGTGEDLLVAPDITNSGCLVDPREDSAWSSGDQER